MTKLIIETDDGWTREKIRDVIFTEINLLNKAINRIQSKLKDFENKYGKLDRKSLYGKVDDMELIEWEGEMETLGKLQKKLKSLEEITFEYK
ncbi:MAG: hypothetical protein HY578_05630 [Nitrospinae bacterium]|nr:hypothetical protein [Nitrospinota bacterium]